VQRVAADRSERLARVLILGGVVGPPLFVLVFLVEGAMRPGYDPVRLPLSLLALTGRGWVQTANFLLCGVLSVGLAWGLGMRPDSSRPLPRLGRILIALFGLGLIAAGVFPTGPGGGYPPGVRGSSSDVTAHDVATLVVFASLALAALVAARTGVRSGDRGWAATSAIAGVVLVVGFALMVVAFSSRSELSPIGGLIQRLTVIVGWGWLMALALREAGGPGWRPADGPPRPDAGR
jgi:hypothetical membrane protein